MKSNILNEHNKGENLNNDLKIQLIDKGRTLGRNEVWDSLKKIIKYNGCIMFYGIKIL
jgi:hypothetical protein